ncbi:MAG: N-acetylmuramate alpha-1-phosphate uridylyltransferase MurU [Ostreibacterium sp.]
MKAMILAAGRGKRMQGLTKNHPKPLLMVADKALIEWQIERLQQAGFSEIVINVGYLGQQIQAFLGDGSFYGVTITYSVEPQIGLETGGGVFQALSLLGNKPFLLTNADVFCDYAYERFLHCHPDSIHLVLVDNPIFKDKGDFSLMGKKWCREQTLTFSGISVINQTSFQQSAPGFYPILPLFDQAIMAQSATAEHYSGEWHDIGTPERLLEVNKRYG